MDKWTELRSAYLVAKLGTVSAAADTLGVHRATINRHIEALEQALGAILFQRHARGYTPTEAGCDMLETAARAEEMFNDLRGRNQGRNAQLSGELIVTTLSGIANLIMPALAAFRAAHPEVALTFATSTQLARLEYGEAHVAIRAGDKPEEPDYVVLPFREMRFTLYAHQDYLARHGKPQGLDDLNAHYFIGSLISETREPPYSAWMRAHISPTAFALKTPDPRAIFYGVLHGLGIGFLAEHEAAAYPELIPIVPPQAEWDGHLWIVTHVDLHRTSKVQAFIKLLRDST